MAKDVKEMYLRWQMVNHLARVDFENNWSEKTGYVTPKPGRVVYRSSQAPDSIPKVGDRFTAKGKFYPILASDLLGKRTVFRKKPVKVGEQELYMELKGYGRNGKEMFFREHGEGDVFFGMYLNNVVRKLQYLEKAVGLQLHVPEPIAGIEIDRETYLKQGLKTLEQILGFEINMGHVDEKRMKDTVGDHDREKSGLVARRVIDNLLGEYGNNVEDVVYCITNEFPSKRMHRCNIGLAIQGKALLSKKPVGYAIRASRYPLRVGDPSDQKIDTPSNHTIARQVGHTFRSLLENGLFHICPSTGNMTLAGELTDFVDVINPNTEMHRAYEYMNALKNSKLLKQRTLPSFLRCIIGPPHTGVLSGSFIEGMYGKGVSLDQAARNLLKFF
jgi:hypothetical protein